MSGFVAIRLFSTGMPSMMKMAVAPVSIIACATFCRQSCPGVPKRARAVATIVCGGTDWLRYDVGVFISGFNCRGCILRCDDSNIIILYICLHIFYLSGGQRNFQCMI